MTKAIKQLNTQSTRKSRKLIRVILWPKYVTLMEINRFHIIWKNFTIFDWFEA